MYSPYVLYTWVFSILSDIHLYILLSSCRRYVVLNSGCCTSQHSWVQNSSLSTLMKKMKVHFIIFVHMCLKLIYRADDFLVRFEYHYTMVFWIWNISSKLPFCYYINTRSLYCNFLEEFYYTQSVGIFWIYRNSCWI